MSAAPASEPQSSSNTLKVVLMVLTAFVLVCIVIPICMIALLAIMGPQVGNVFSRITNGLAP